MKSHERDQLEIAFCIIEDAIAKCIAVVPDLRDLKTIRSRVKKEGISFLTITLPAFCKDFERCLAIGRIDSTDFPGFRKSGAIPAFLQGMLSLVFDSGTGELLHEQTRHPGFDIPVIVGSIRQICLAFKKLEYDCTPEREAAAISNFIQVESNLSTTTLDPSLHDCFFRASRILWDGVVSNIKVDTLLPLHGPGVTAERISGNQKYRHQSWYERLERYFPLIDNAYSISAYDSEEFEQVTFVPPEAELPVRVALVPKTLKGPRIIAIEPVCMQYAQQAIRTVLYEQIEKHSRLASGHVNFRDQSINRDMALRASIDGSYATIDLSDASDRVYHDLAMLMFFGNPDLSGAIDACRSTHAKLPSGQIIGPLKKFASMGSALCFPIEAMYFYTICVVALLEIHSLPYTYANVYNVSRGVFVYGDDIIVPSEHAVAILDYLQRYNCKVNTSKTFWHGNFRESCGMDAYMGEEVTPTYIRKLVPESRHQADRIISYVKTANIFYKRGYWKTAELLFNRVERIIGLLPYVSETSPALGRNTFLQGRSVGRWNDSLHRFEVKAWVGEPVYRTDVLDGYAALQKSLTTLHLRSEDADVDPLHLERSALHGEAALKRRWVPSQ